MEKSEWCYYNNAIIPTLAPHKVPNVTGLDDSFFKSFPEYKKIMFCRWTDNWDKKEPSSWWYVIKDSPFDLSQINSKKRNVINKGLKNFDVKLIDPCLYKKEIYDVTEKAYSAYPPSYRPIMPSYGDFSKIIEAWQIKVYGAFYKEDLSLQGYSLIIDKSNEEGYIGLNVQKTNPFFERLSINAALVYKIVSDYTDFLKSGGYILDGARNILHKTSFQDYLEKYFLFRKAYCDLHIFYKRSISFAVTLLFPFRFILKKFDSSNFVHKINGVLLMEELIRKKKDNTV